MARKALIVALVIVLAGLIVGGYLLYQRGIAPQFVIWRCARALQKAPSIEADVQTKLFLGPLKPTITVHVKHAGKGLELIDAGEAVFYSLPAPGCVVYPRLKAVVQLQGNDAAREFQRVIDHWGGGRIRRWLTDALNGGTLTLRPPESVGGHICWVVEYAFPASEYQAGDVPEKLSFLPLAIDWKTLIDSVKRMRLFVDRETGIPARAEFLGEQNAPVVVNTVSNARLGGPMPREAFTFTPPEGYTVTERKLDAEAPWKTFLPPETAGMGYLEQKVRSFLDRR